MTKYKVKLMFLYSDTIHVEAENEKEAISKAFDECHEECESFYDFDVEQEAS